MLPVTSCIFGRRKPLPPPAAAPVQLPADHRPPQRIEEPPEIIPPELPPPAPRLEIPSPPPKTETAVDEPEPARRRTAPPAPVAQPAPTPAPAKVPQLAPLLSDEERRAYDTAIDALVARTTQNLMRARGRTLSAAEKDSLVRAEAFLEQARETRKIDPAAAKSLAERAELLSRHAAGQ